MAITDPVQSVLEAIVFLLNADTELRTLFERSSGIVSTWERFDSTTPLPVLLYLPVTAQPAWTGTQRLEVQFTAYARTKDIANKAVARVPQVLTTTQFATRSLDVARDPDRPLLRQWGDIEPVLGDMAHARADLSLNLLIPG